MTQDARELDPDLHWRLEGRLIIWSQFDPALYAKTAARLAGIDEQALTTGTGAGVLLAAWAIVEARQAIRGLARWTLPACAGERGIRRGAERLNIVNALVALVCRRRRRRGACVRRPDLVHAEKGDQLSLAAFQLFRGQLRSERGDLLAAEEDLRPLDRAVFHDSPGFQSYRAAFLAEALLERGDMVEAKHWSASPSPGTADTAFTSSRRARGCGLKRAMRSRRWPIR